MSEKITELKSCPFCGGQVILCKESGNYTPFSEFSLLCLKCSIEFKIKRNPMENMAQYVYEPAKAVNEIIEKFNARCEEQQP